MQLTNELNLLIEKSKIIVIVGPPAAGKTTLTDLIAERFNNVPMIMRSDDYIKYGFKDAVYKMMEDIEKAEFSKIVIEGIQTARLLRKGIELGTFSCDLIIKLECDLETLSKRYFDREGKAYPLATFKAIDTVWKEVEPHLPVITTLYRLQND